jgi:hypothetical protein
MGCAWALTKRVGLILLRQFCLNQVHDDEVLAHLVCGATIRALFVKWASDRPIFAEFLGASLAERVSALERQRKSLLKVEPVHANLAA